MLYLNNLLEGTSFLPKPLWDDVEINNIHIDSRKVIQGDLFVAQKGIAGDGHDYIKTAIENGAKVIICERKVEEVSGIIYIQSSSTKAVLPILLNNFHNNPSDEINIVGVIGTNGKTTVTSLLYDLFTAAKIKVGLISTVVYKIGDLSIPSTHTTPDPVSFFNLLAKMRDEECKYVFMEVSSHALHQGRVDGVRFAGGVFTNITHEHLDYHKTFLNYLNAKKLFFDHLPSDAFAIVNADDKNGKVMLQNCKARKLTYALQRGADYKVSILESSIRGTLLRIQDIELFSKIIGDFNAYNMLAVFGVAIELGLDSQLTCQLLSGLDAPDGRFDNYSSENGLITGIVDYAHTPDAIENVLKVLSKLVPKGNKVIMIFGCGGDRDKAKRPIMASIAGQYSDVVIFTSDNPRTEDPVDIMKEMRDGLTEEQDRNAFSIIDREEAIKLATTIAKDGDIILVAGKGHENYQDVQGVKHHFEDKKMLIKYLN